MSLPNHRGEVIFEAQYCFLRDFARVRLRQALLHLGQEQIHRLRLGVAQYRLSYAALIDLLDTIRHLLKVRLVCVVVVLGSGRRLNALGCSMLRDELLQAIRHPDVEPTDD